MSKIIGQEDLIKEVNRIFQISKNSQCRLSIEALLKKGGKVTGCIGFPWDPKKYTNVCKFCANFGNHSDGSKGCLKPYGGTDCYVWITMPNGDVLGACDNFEILINSNNK